MTEPTDTIDRLGLSIAAQFVPFSQSRNAKPDPKTDDLSLNWRVTVGRNGAPFMEADYMQGIGHAPSYKQSARLTVATAEALAFEAEKGRRAPRSGGLFAGALIPEPSAADVLYTLVSDAGALDHPTFEDWAAELGYDTDSRKAEATYRACLEIGLKLRAAVGDGGLEQLRTAFQDY